MFKYIPGPDRILFDFIFIYTSMTFQSIIYSSIDFKILNIKILTLFQGIRWILVEKKYLFLLQKNYLLKISIKISCDFMNFLQIMFVSSRGEMTAWWPSLMCMLVDIPLFYLISWQMSCEVSLALVFHRVSIFWSFIILFVLFMENWQCS